MRTTIFYLLFLMPVCLIQAQAPPPAINYQGTLINADGTTPDGPHDLEFNIYDAATDGNKEWGPQNFSGVPLVDGHFNVILSEDANTSPIQVAFGTVGAEGRFLDVKLGSSGSQISFPRQEILSAPFAFRALSAATSDFAGVIGDATVGPAALIDDAVTSPALAPDAVSTENVINQSLLGEDIADNQIGANHQTLGNYAQTVVQPSAGSSFFWSNSATFSHQTINFTTPSDRLLLQLAAKGRRPVLVRFTMPADSALPSNQFGNEIPITLGGLGTNSGAVPGRLFWRISVLEDGGPPILHDISMAQYGAGSGSGVNIPHTSVYWILRPTIGTEELSIEALVRVENASLRIRSNLIFEAMEL